LFSHYYHSYSVFQMGTSDSVSALRAAELVYASRCPSLRLMYRRIAHSITRDSAGAVT
jgi:hypothetical protein